MSRLRSKQPTGNLLLGQYVLEILAVGMPPYPKLSWGGPEVERHPIRFLVMEGRCGPFPVYPGHTPSPPSATASGRHQTAGQFDRRMGVDTVAVGADALGEVLVHRRAADQDADIQIAGAVGLVQR